MKKILLLNLFFLQTFIAFAQWTTVPSGTNTKLYSVDYFDPASILVGSEDMTLKSIDDGNTWIARGIFDITNTAIPYTNMEDIAAINLTEEIGVGYFNLGINELILKTNNGINWNAVSSSSGTSVKRTIAVDVKGNKAVVVGSRGRIAYSTNFGNSWTFTGVSGFTSFIYDVKFATDDTVYACGYTSFFRSDNGGVTWSRKILTGSYASVTCDKNVVYTCLTGVSNTLLKSTDYGNTFTTISLPFSLQEEIYALNKDTLLASGTNGIYISKTGGQTWEKYNLASYAHVNCFDFLNNATGIAVGDNGYIVKTTNLALAPTLPIAKFDIVGSANYCSGDSIQLQNQTSPFPNYTYTWKLNGVPFSTQYNESIIVSNSIKDTITLTVSNQYGSSSFTKYIFPINHVVPSFTLQAQEDTVCVGNSPQFLVPASNPTLTYQLRKGFTNIGAAQTGTGNTLIFNSPFAVVDSTEYNIIAKRTTVCAIDTLVKKITVYSFIGSNNPTPACFPINTANNGQTGITSFQLGTINNTSSYSIVNYSSFVCNQQTDLIMGNTYPLSFTTTSTSTDLAIYIDMNGNGIFELNDNLINCGSCAGTTNNLSITIPTTTVFNKYIVLRIKSGQLSLGIPCSKATNGETEDYKVRILHAPSPPVTKFGFTINKGCNYAVTFKDSSYNMDSYKWSFGDGTFDTVPNPPQHIYTVTGTYYVKLITCNPYGCDTMVQPITVIIPKKPIAPDCISNYIYTPTCLPIQGISFGTINQNSPGSFPTNQYYRDLTCLFQTKLISDSSYLLIVNHVPNVGWVAVWIDYNGDGIFSASERIGSNSASSQTSIFIPITIPHTPLFYTPVRMRVSLGDNTYSDACSNDRGYTNDYTLFFYPSSPIVFNLTAPTYLCANNRTITFTNQNLNISSQLWDFGDNTTSASITPTHTYASNGNYTVKLRACNSGYCDSVYYVIHVTNLPQAPTISALFGTLTSSAFSGNQWYFNGNIIPGATHQTYVTNANGNYAVTFTDSNGCSSLASSPYLMVSTLIPEYAEAAFKIYPNPVEDKLTLDFVDEHFKRLWILIYDAMGNAVIKFEANSKKNEINLSNLSAGLYFVSIEGGTKPYRYKIIKE